MIIDLGEPMCDHIPRCPRADESDCCAAHVRAAHPEQGWSLLCNGVVLFDDLGMLLPDGRHAGQAGRVAADG
jgi:hypothetical protein